MQHAIRRTTCNDNGPGPTWWRRRAARYLARHGARVTVTDLAGASELNDSLDQLAGTPIERFHLSGHCEADFTDADLVIVNPAVRPDNRFIALAQAAGGGSRPRSKCSWRPAPRVIGVTGTTGKSTTAAMLAAALDASGRRAWLGGNIGGSLLVDLERMTPNDWVVLRAKQFSTVLAQRERPLARVGRADQFRAEPSRLAWQYRALPTSKAAAA